MISIFNSLTRQKEPFVPMQPGKVGLYLCGITVYDYCHIGHARCNVVFDLVVRHLRAQGYDVEYIRNITDVDDKIIKRALSANISVNVLTTQFIDAMHEDFDRLNILRPDKEPRATEYIAHMIALIEKLIANDIAYVSDSGDVCYSVEKFPNYGALSHKDLEGLQAGARVDVTTDKRNPLDFVLWKRAKADEPSWPSPWGDGRPGWHIECSAMSMDCLGEEFDLHGGGADLQFPHHENEIAQSCGASGKAFAKTWMHVGFVQVDSEKMSKSLGNFFTIREVLEKFHPEVVRYFMVASHYRSPVNYSDVVLQNAKGALDRMYLALRGVHIDKSAPPAHRIRDAFNQAMNDDFNTPEALAVLFELVREINTAKESGDHTVSALGALLLELGGQLGLLRDDPEAFLTATNVEIDAAAIEALIAERESARAQKNWARADEIRDELAASGVVLEDSAKGTQWRVE